MTTIAAGSRLRARFLPFDEEEWAQARPRSRGLSRLLVAWLLLPALMALVTVGIMYASQTAQATALTYQIAALRATKAQLLSTQQLQVQKLDQLQSAGQVAQAAGELGMAPPSAWTVVNPPTSSQDPLTPVLVALRGG
jgi:hypothetical protein